MTAHTPAPWFACEPDDAMHAVRRVHPTLPPRLSSIVADVGYSGSVETDIANARLISAAPELLAVLLKLRRGDLHQRARYLYEEAEAAIAKAVQP